MLEIPDKDLGKGGYKVQSSRPEIVQMIRGFAVRNPIIVEFGSNTGAFAFCKDMVDLVKPLHYDCIEPYAKPILDAGLMPKGYHWWPVHAETYTQSLGNVNRADFVVMNDVLEHLEAPMKVLQWSKKVLGKTGRLILSLPNIANIGIVENIVVQSNWRYEDAGTLDRTHRWFFTQNSLAEIIQSLGGRIEAYMPINVLNQEAYDDLIEKIKLNPDIILPEFKIHNSQGKVTMTLHDVPATTLVALLVTQFAVACRFDHT